MTDTNLGNLGVGWFMSYNPKTKKSRKGDFRSLVNKNGC
jgi:hypothetical protein